jgi:hypothetical protein
MSETGLLNPAKHPRKPLGLVQKPKARSAYGVLFTWPDILALVLVYRRD